MFRCVIQERKAAEKYDKYDAKYKWFFDGYRKLELLLSQSCESAGGEGGATINIKSIPVHEHDREGKCKSIWVIVRCKSKCVNVYDIIVE